MSKTAVPDANHRRPHLAASAPIAAVVVVIIAWFAILFTGRYPRWAFTFTEGVLRWHNRVVAYALVMVTDRYPPFGLAP